jgi:hypothetical protein
MGALLAWPCSCLVVCLLFRRRFNSTIHRAAAQCRSSRDDDASEAVSLLAEYMKGDGRRAEVAGELGRRRDVTVVRVAASWR